MRLNETEAEPAHREPVKSLTARQADIWDASPYSAANQKCWARIKADAEASL